VTLEPAIKGQEKGTFVPRKGMKAQPFLAELEPGLLPAYFVKAYHHAPTAWCHCRFRQWKFILTPFV